MQMIHTNYGYVSKTEAQIIGRLDKQTKLHKSRRRHRHQVKTQVWHNPNYQTHRPKQRIVHIRDE